MTHFHVPRKSSRKRIAQLNITSLIDIFTILLVFLLKNYSVEGDIVSISPNLELPSAAVDKKPNRDFLVTISKDYITVEQEHIVDIGNLPELELSIPELKQELVSHRNKVEEIQKTNSRVTFTGKVLLQGDKDTQFRILKQVMYTCGEAGYKNISLVLRKKE